MTANKGSGQEMDLDGFLGHTTRGAMASYLDGWTKNDPPIVRIVLHTRAPIMSVWRNNWPRIVTRERDGKETREVWSGHFNSWETEDILKAQYRRDDSGERVSPPQICPMALMLEEVHRLYREGALEWDTPLFRFMGDDPTKGKTLHAAPMLGLMKKIWPDLTDTQKRDARKRGVPGPMDAWKEAMMAKCYYVFTVVDYDNPADGLQVAQETTLVGDKMKTAIRDKIKAEGPDKGHPQKTPYVFQWEYNANESEFGKKYHVVPLGAAYPITTAIKELIYEKDPPDISRLIARGNIQELRTSMEAYYVGPEGLLDFDYIFGAAERLLGMDEALEPDEDGDAAEIADDIVGEPLEEGVEAEPEVEADADDAVPDEAVDEAADEETPAEDEEQVVDEEPEPEPAPRPAPKAAAKPATAAPAAAAPPAGRRLRKPAEDPKYVVADRRVEEGEERSFAADGMELFSCDECQTLMRADEDTCRKCGAKYDVEAVEQAPPAKAPAKPAVPAKPAQAAKPAAAPAKPAQAPAGAKPAAAAPSRPAAPATNGKPAAAAAPARPAAPAVPARPAAGKPAQVPAAAAKAKAAGKDRLGF